MNPVIIAAGVYLSSKIISFIAGELTESELIKQKEIETEINSIQSNYQNVIPSDTTDKSIQENEKVVAKRKEINNYLIEEAKKRIDDYSELHKEIKESKRKVLNALKTKDVIFTPLRKSSLELLFRQLCEAQEKCYSYIQYLSAYNDEVNRDVDKVEPTIFGMQLPPDYPYVGKVLWISAEQLTGDKLKYEIEGPLPLNLHIADIKSYEIIDNSIYPIMVTYISKREITASLEKGAFKAYELTNTHLGFSATVKKIQKKYVILTYQHNLNLFLPKKNLINPDRFPPIRSSLTVYPVKWEYNLTSFSLKKTKESYPVTVSERKEDAGSSLAFNCFPICFTEEDLSLFIEYYEKNNLGDYDEEFLIGPLDSECISLKKGTELKLQFGDIPLFYIIVDEYENRSDILRYYFRFHGLCNGDEKTFSADDIFLPFDVSFSPYYAETSEEMIQQYMGIDNLDDVSALIWDLFEEFRIQHQIRNDQEGISFFFKWENITSQLISVLEQGDSIPLKVRWVEAGRKDAVFADIDNSKELESFISQFANKIDSKMVGKWKPQFFVKDETGNRYNATVMPDAKRLRIVGKNVFYTFGDSSKTIDLYASNKPYAEYQQKAALHQFRIGQVVNPLIQAACLNSANILNESSNTCEMVPFHNANLESNLSQKEAVEKAFKEKNIFFIQGPPGTGKTTVIRELVEQVLDTNDHSRILIVSQANVAVDNALSGLIEKYEDQIVRCGNGDKISASFQKLRLQNRCQDYLEKLNNRRERFEDGFFKEWEDTITSNDLFEYSPSLCELIIRSHRLIGATCVGLAKRSIGLERTEFDLVIIDEAGKALPAELLIPLVRARKVVIIGDQRQLPPVINPIYYDKEKIDLEERIISENELFSHSFFERLYENAPESCKVMLDTQYRMPSVIGTAISKLFYDGKLKNAPRTENKKSIVFDTNITFINYDGDNSFIAKKNKSLQLTNQVEANAVVSLVSNIRKKDSSCTIAVITPYKGQKWLIYNRFLNSCINPKQNNIWVDTIDSFQGSEADVVVFCTTRANRPTHFFMDSKRINVALSRAKRELIIIGKLEYLKKFSGSESCLPGLADYIIENGNIVSASSCQLIQGVSSTKKVSEIILPLDMISLPAAFLYSKENEKEEVQNQVEEYYHNGYFLNPPVVKRTSRGYILVDHFEQYRAALEMDLSECICKIVQ